MATLSTLGEWKWVPSFESVPVVLLLFGPKEGLRNDNLDGLSSRPPRSTETRFGGEQG